MTREPMNRKMRRAAQAGAKRTSPARQPGAADLAFVQALLDEGWRLLDAGQDGEATELAIRAVRLLEHPDTRAFFVECARRWRYFDGAERISDLVVRALRTPWTIPADLAGISRGILDHHSVIGPAIQQAHQAWPRRLALSELVGAHTVAAMAAAPLLLAVLEVTKVCELDFEHFLTSLRAGLLGFALDASNRRPDDATIRLACALARQCMLNQYVFDVTAEERQRVTELLHQINSPTVAAISPLALAMSACYTPLDGLARNVLAKRSWPASLAQLLEEIAVHATAEQRYLKSTPRLTAINDATSLAVQRQYEENPYPRWAKLPEIARPLGVDEWFRRTMPFANYRPSGQAAPDILIAGCGTGHEPIQFAQSYRGARVLAIDLSLSSLAYAREKTREMGLENVEYAQADILELGALNRTFDVISAGGVLHHLADPEAGWRHLLDLLRPDGCMKIALYSESARRNISAARAWLASRGYGSSADDIRRARQDLAMAAIDTPQFQDVLRCPDFFGTGECRDLLFHVQESCFTIPRIRRFLDQNNLNFLGFIHYEQVMHQFRQQFSHQAAADLDRWHQFELEHPDTFATMYQFWIQPSRRMTGGT